MRHSGATPNDAFWTLLWLLGYTPIFSVGRCLRHRLAYFLLKMKAWLHSRWVSPGIWTTEQHRFSNGLCTTEFQSMALSCLTQSLWSLLQLSSQAGRQSLSDLEDRVSWSISVGAGQNPRFRMKLAPTQSLLLLTYCFVLLGLPVLEIHPICFFLWAFGLNFYKVLWRSNPFLFLLYFLKNSFYCQIVMGKKWSENSMCSHAHPSFSHW